MRIVILFAHPFLDWPKAMMRTLSSERPDIEIIALAKTKLVYDNLKAEKDLKFLDLIDLEAREYEWLDKTVSATQIKACEDEFGAHFLRELVIADRHMGAGYFVGALPLYSELYFRTRNQQAIHNHIVNMLGYYKELFGKHRPDAVFCYSVAASFTLALAKVTQHYGAAFRTTVPTRIGQRYIVDSSPVGHMDVVREAFEAGRKRPETLEPWREEAQRWIGTFRGAGNAEPHYAAFYRQKFAKERGWGMAFRNMAETAAKTALYPFMRGRRPLRGEPGWVKLWNAVTYPFFWRMDAAFPKYKSIDDLPEKFVFYALHVDPEASTMVYAPKTTNQLAVIQAIAKNLPLSVPVVVKDHLFMMGRRPRGFYKQLASMPGVILISPFENSHNLIKKAAVTATITGTVAWEAILYKKPALTFGYNPVMIMGQGYVHCPDLTQTDEALDKAFKLKPADEDVIIDYVAAILKESFDCPTQLLWGGMKASDFAAHTATTRALMGRIIAPPPAAQKTARAKKGAAAGG